MLKQIKVNGMSCSHCVGAVTGALEELGLTGIQVSLETGIATFDGTGLSLEAIRAAIDDVGFEAEEV